MASGNIECCPFCGGPARVSGNGTLGKYVVCRSCLASSSSFGTSANAIAAWNRRIVPSCVVESWTGADWVLSCGHRIKGPLCPTYCPDCGRKVIGKL